MTKKQLDSDTLARYLGPAQVHPIEYWCKMWRLFDEKGKSILIKCTEQNKCNMYYTDSEGMEHRDAIYEISQLPIAYQQEKVSGEIQKSIISSTQLNYERAVMLFGEPHIDPDIPFIYEWFKGGFRLQLVGKVFSTNEIGKDDRSTVSFFGQLPMPFRAFLNTQNNKEAQKQIPLQMPNPDDVLISTPASEAAMKMENSPNPVAEYAENPNRIETSSNYRGPGSGMPVTDKGYMLEHLDGKGSIIENDEPPTPDQLGLTDEAYTPSFAEQNPAFGAEKPSVADEGFDLNATLKRMGVSTTKNIGDSDIRDDDDSFVSSAALQNSLAPQQPPSNPKRKEYNPIPPKSNETAERPNTLEAWEGVRDGKVPEPVLKMRRQVRAAKAAETRAKNKAKKQKVKA